MKPLTADEIEIIDRIQRAGRSGTHYDVLQIDQSASKEEVERAYKEFVRAWHPDAFSRRDVGDRGLEIDENFGFLTTARVTLANDVKRAAYDRDLKARGIVPTPRPTQSIMEPGPMREEVVSFQRTKSGVVIQHSEPSTHSAASTQAAAKQPPRFIQTIKDKIAERLAKARVYHRDGKVAAEAGNWPQAENLFYLATRYDPANAEYAAAYKDAVAHARLRRVANYLQQGDTSVSYGRLKEAIAAYQKACDCDPPEGVAYFKLGQLLLSSEDDVRGAVNVWRKAVSREPRNVTYRLALADGYEKAGLRQNAEKEIRVALEIEPRNADALTALKRLRTAGA